MPQIEEQYIKTGKVYYIYRDLPLLSIHPGALQAAHVANCAADQGAFWPMHSRLFGGQASREWGAGGAADLATMLGYAGDLAIDRDALAQCVENSRHAAQIEADVRDAVGRGINSTPAFLVNGQPVFGARPFDSWKQLFDQLLTQP
jgi:protein-disulfide isomerase